MNTTPQRPSNTTRIALSVACLLLAARFAPDLLHARDAGGCIQNLKQIDGAVKQWALENKKTAFATYKLTDPALLKFLKGSVLPKCPDGGVYSEGKAAKEVPKCNIPGHALQKG